MRPTLPATVTVTRARHALEGRELRVLGWMRRHGDLELMLELPDGSKRLIPAQHTSLDGSSGRPEQGTGTLGLPRDLLAASALASAFSARSAADREQAARNPPAREDNRAPVQLSLLPQQAPAPPPELIGQFPEHDVAAAVTLLAVLIARMAVPAGTEADDERA